MKEKIFSFRISKVPKYHFWNIEIWKIKILKIIFQKYYLPEKYRKTMFLIVIFSLMFSLIFIYYIIQIKKYENFKKFLKFEVLTYHLWNTRFEI